MSNSISWGEIYKSSWWGNGVTSNSISWGIIYRNIAGFPVFVNLFEDRVIADGGVAESLRCISENLQVLSQPTITLIGNNPDYVDVNTAYVDAGATAFDEFIYGDLTSLITSDSDVDSNNAGLYKVSYEVVDSSNRTAVSSRDVYVLSELAYGHRDRVIADGGVVEKIQCTEFDYNVNWGYYLGLQSGFSRFLSEYESRISADVGTLESLNCIRNSFLSEFDWTYNYRVIDDGGSVEKLGCININELIYKN